MARRLLADQEAGIGTDRDRARHRLRVEFGDRSARAGAGVVDHHVGHALRGHHRVEQAADLLGLRGLAGEGRCRRLVCERREPVRVARRQRHLQAVLREQPRQRGAEAASDADDQG
jgi:hypothetical protein